MFISSSTPRLPATPSTQSSHGLIVAPFQNSSEMLDVFSDIQKGAGSTDGLLTKQQLENYNKGVFAAVESPHNTGRTFFEQNFDAIAKLDGDANSISANDLAETLIAPLTSSELFEVYSKIQKSAGSKDGLLTKQQLKNFNNGTFLDVISPFNTGRTFLEGNFDAIAKRDGDASSISAKDFAEMRDLDPPVTTPAPKVTTPPTPPVNEPQTEIMQVVIQILQLFMRLLMPKL
jgi:hypothetical protein